MTVQEKVHKLTDQKKLKEKYKDSDLFSKVSKANVVGTMEAIKKYLKSCHGVKRAPLAYIIRKTITVKTSWAYPPFLTSYN